MGLIRLQCPEKKSGKQPLSGFRMAIRSRDISHLSSHHHSLGESGSSSKGGLKSRTRDWDMLDFRFCRRRRDGLTAEHSNFARPPDDRLAICESNGGQEVVRLRVNGDDCEWDEAGGCEGVAAVDASDLCF